MGIRRLISFDRTHGNINSTLRNAIKKFEKAVKEREFRILVSDKAENKNGNGPSYHGATSGRQRRIIESKQRSTPYSCREHQFLLKRSI